MLNKADMDMIKEARQQMTKNRKQPLTLIGEEVVGEDPFTGDPITEEFEVEVEGIFKNQTGTSDLQYINGVALESGDAVVSFDIEVDLSNVDTIRKVDETEWTLVAKDEVGLGEPNRTECLARKVT